MDTAQAQEVIKTITDQLAGYALPKLVLLLHQTTEAIAEETVKVTLFGGPTDMLIRHLMLNGLIVSEMLSRYEEKDTKAVTEKG